MSAPPFGGYLAAFLWAWWQRLSPSGRKAVGLFAALAAAQGTAVAALWAAGAPVGVWVGTCLAVGIAVTVVYSIEVGL